MTVNHCETCSLCCKLLGVQELQKMPHEWCLHYISGIGCAIHKQPAFPADCDEYVCLWRQAKDEGHALPDALRPDRCKVIIDADKFATNVHYVRCDQAYPTAWRKPQVQKILGALALAGSEIYLVTATGEKRRLHVISG